MTDAIRMEWVRLRTLRSTWGVLLGALVIAGGIGILIGNHQHDNVTSTTLVDSLQNGAGQLPPLLLGLVGVFAFGHDFRHGTIRQVLTAVPRRGVLAGARTLVMALFALVSGLAVTGSAALGGVLGSRGELLHHLSGPDVTRVAVGVALFNAGFVLIGTALGALTRNVPAAVSVLLVGPTIAEQLLHMLFDQYAKGLIAWLPFNDGWLMFNTTEVEHTFSPLGSGLVFYGFAALLTAVGATLFVRKDA